jgi:TRAP-type C4-dicarboxylate transport system permease small subunit
MLIYGINVSTELWQTEFPMLKISQGWLYLSVPVSSVFFILYSLEELFYYSKE